MKKLYLYHFGIGNIGKKLIELIMAQKKNLKDKYDVELIYCAGIDRQGGVFAKEGLSQEQLSKLSSLDNKAELSQTFQKYFLYNPSEIYQYLSSSSIIIDTTDSDKIHQLLLQGFKKKAFAVLSNKKPLAGSIKIYRNLMDHAQGRLFYETTVGAGLPVIQTLESLLVTGDEIIEIQGCFSGTLGYLFSRLEEGAVFSKAVWEAKEKGYTEPDPRDDLSGLDVARKALILGRLLGQEIDIDDIEIESLFPHTMAKLSVAEFMEKAEELDGQFILKQQYASKKKAKLRYVASVTPTGCRVGIEAVSPDNDLANLKGPDNMIVFKTKRYNKNPLVIKGPGAGIEVTAAGVLADIVRIIKIVSDKI